MFLITSLSPKQEKVSQQYAAIQSWIRAGFEVISFNSIRDIATIREYKVYDEFNIYFEESETNLVGLANILRKFNSVEFCLVNADIEFTNNEEVWNIIKNTIEEENILLYLCRYNYNNDKSDCELERFGIDTFFVPKGFYMNVAEKIPDYLYIGKPLWDYFLPFIAVQETIRITLKYSHQPLTFHKNHEKRWNKQEWVEIANRLRKDFPILNVERLRDFSPRIRNIFIPKANLFRKL